jgi:hypothetical protein
VHSQNPLNSWFLFWKRAIYAGPSYRVSGALRAAVVLNHRIYIRLPLKLLAMVAVWTHMLLLTKSLKSKLEHASLSKRRSLYRCQPPWIQIFYRLFPFHDSHIADSILGKRSSLPIISSVPSPTDDSRSKSAAKQLRSKPKRASNILRDQDKFKAQRCSWETRKFCRLRRE